MKYFIDTEFLEGTQKERFPISLFRKNTPPTIDLISIGIVAEDGREFYAISKDFNLKEAWNRYDLEQQSGDMRNIFPEGKKVYWLRENVLKTIFEELLSKFNKESDASLEMDSKTPNSYIGCIPNQTFRYSLLKFLINYYGKTNKQIAEEIKHFCNSEYHCIKAKRSICSESDQTPFSKKPEFYAYYADYDWVVFCWIFGKMMDLPSGFPKYCKDLKQMMDDKAKKVVKGLCFGENEDEIERMADRSVAGQVESFKTFEKYPKPENEHSAIDDARWNKKLFDFLTNL